MRRISILLAALALAAGAGLLPRALNATAATPALSFGVPRIVDPIHLYGEPDIKVSPNSVIHVSGPQGTGVQRSIWNVSVDRGDSWRLVQGLPDKQALGPNKGTGGPGGGDTEIAISRANRVFFSDLWNLTCFTAGTTTDNGKTVASSPLGCSHPPADRQWMGVFDPPAHSSSSYTGPRPLTYQAYDDVVTGDHIDKTTDGLTYTNAGEYADDGTHTVVNGNIVVDQPTGNVLGLVGAPGATGPQFGLALAVGVPDAAGNLSFTYREIANKLAGDPQILFPVLAQDAARNAYVVFGENCNQDVAHPVPATPCFHIYYSWASAADGWTKWAPIHRVDRSPSQTAVMPWVAAGGAGRLDVVWYGSQKRLYPSEHKNQAWDVYMAQVSGANSATPVMSQAKVTPHPMHYDDICLLGTGCITQTGNRNLADFFQVTIDHGGRARIVYNDTSNGLVQPGVPLDHAGGALVTVATQSTGLNALTGADLPPGESAAPTNFVSDAPTDALAPPLGGSPQPGADLRRISVSLTGSTLHVRMTTSAASLGFAAQQAGGTAGQLVARWQMGSTLYYAAVEQAATGAAPTFYAGAATSIDLCSVSGCKPNYLVYPAPPAGGTSVTGTATYTSSGATYDIAVPVSAVGNVHTGSLLEEVMAFSAAAPTPASIPLTNAQALADEVPLMLDGTKTFNFQP